MCLCFREKISKEKSSCKIPYFRMMLPRKSFYKELIWLVVLAIISFAITYCVSGVLIGNTAMDIHLHDTCFSIFGNTVSPATACCAFQLSMATTLLLLLVSLRKRFGNRLLNIILITNTVIFIALLKLVYLILPH